MKRKGSCQAMMAMGDSNRLSAFVLGFHTCIKPQRFNGPQGVLGCLGYLLVLPTASLGVSFFSQLINYHLSTGFLASRVLFLLPLILFFLTDGCLSKKKYMYHTVLIVLRVDLGRSRELMPMFCSPSVTRKSYSCSLCLLLPFSRLHGWKEMIIILSPYLYFQRDTFTPTPTP